MANDEDNRWSDDGLGADVMEKMFSNKIRRRIIDQKPDIENQGDIDHDSKNQETKNIDTTSVEQDQNSDIEKMSHYGQKLLDDKISGNKSTSSVAKFSDENLKEQKLDSKPINRLKSITGKTKDKQKPEKLEKEETTITKSDIQDIKYLLGDIASLIRDTYGYKKYPHDEKGKQAMEEGTALVYKYRNYYDVVNTIKKVGPVDPQDFDSPVYNAERIFEVLERYSDIIYIINDGTETLFTIVSHEGRTNFSKESIILPGETKQYYNVYEFRLRSPTVGHPYRVTEYQIMDVSETSFIPFELISLHDVDLPATNENWFEEDIVPIHPPTTIRIEVAISKTGIFSAAITNGGNTQVVNFNVTSGPELIEDGVYVFELLVHKGDTINFRYSTDSGKIKILRVQEIDASTA